MARKPNTDRHGSAWTEPTKLAVWQKADKYGDHPGNGWRKDKCGNLMKYEDYGDREKNTGWEIDHINPVSNGGSDLLSNLQPLQWKNNADKADKTNWKCPT